MCKLKNSIENWSICEGSHEVSLGLLSTQHLQSSQELDFCNINLNIGLKEFGMLKAMMCCVQNPFASLDVLKYIFKVNRWQELFSISFVKALQLLQYLVLPLILCTWLFDQIQLKSIIVGDARVESVNIPVNWQLSGNYCVIVSSYFHRIMILDTSRIRSRDMNLIKQPLLIIRWSGHI